MVISTAALLPDAEARTRSVRNEGQCQPGVSETDSGPCWEFAPLEADGTYVLPFSFDFGGQSFDTIGISNKGYVWFGTSGDPNLTASSDLAAITTAVIVPFLSTGFAANFGFALTQVRGPSSADPGLGQTVTSLYVGDNAFRVSWGDPFNDENNWGVMIAELEGGAGFVVEVDYGRIITGAGPNDTVLAGFSNGAGLSADFLSLFDPATDIDLFDCSVLSQDDPCGADTAGPDSFVGPGFDVAIPGEFSAITLRDRFLSSHDTSGTGDVDVDGRALFLFASSVIPEPRTWGFMIVGFALAAFSARTKRRQARA